MEPSSYNLIPQTSLEAKKRKQKIVLLIIALVVVVIFVVGLGIKTTTHKNTGQKGTYPTNDRPPTDEQEDPILTYLPHKTLHYTLQASSATTPGKHPKLEAQILLPPGVVDNQATTMTTQYKQEVEAYIIGLKLSPKDYTIDYSVVYETLTGV